MVSFLKTPLQPNNAKEIIENLFHEKPQWLKSELSKALLKNWLESGGEEGRQSSSQVCKKVLQRLKTEGVIVHAGAKGLWRKTTNNTQDILKQNTYNKQDALDNNTSLPRPKSAIKQIGSGSEIVYLYYDPTSKELADKSEKSVWPCKIGSTTTGSSYDRIMSQGAKTAFSSKPVIALDILTDNSTLLEKMIQNALKIAGTHSNNEVGTEWFNTNPEKIIEFYNSILPAIQKLKNTP